MTNETPAQDIRNALMILHSIEGDKLDVENRLALIGASRRLQDALNKLESSKPELKVCSRCKENTEFYYADDWYSVCCDARPIQVDVEPDDLGMMIDQAENRAEGYV